MEKHVLPALKDIAIAATPLVAYLAVTAPEIFGHPPIFTRGWSFALGVAALVWMFFWVIWVESGGKHMFAKPQNDGTQGDHS